MNLEFIAETKLDYHEYGIINHYEIEKTLSEFIEDCYINKHKKVLVITGNGSVIKPLVQKLLKQIKFIESFKQAGYFNGQKGAFEVVLK